MAEASQSSTAASVPIGSKISRGFLDDVATETGVSPPRGARGSAPPPPPPPRRRKLGRCFGAYQVVRRVNSGGMGAVYEARHLRLGRRAAVKVMHEWLVERPHLKRRFVGEATAAARIAHPGVVEIFDYGQADDGTPYMVMEYLDGESLADRELQVGPLPIEEILAIGAQIAETVGAAHQAGVVHRDLKPDNVLLSRDASAPGGVRVKVLDFGCAKFVGEKVTATMVTQHGKLLGTPWYMSPEQCRSAGEIDERTDVYALGCLLYELACGRPPFKGQLESVLRSHLYERPTPPGWLRVDIPMALERLILRMLSKRPDERPASMAEVEQALVSIAARRREATPPPTPAIATERSPAKPRPRAARRESAPRAPRLWRRRTLALALLASSLLGTLAAFAWL